MRNDNLLKNFLFGENTKYLMKSKNFVFFNPKTVFENRAQTLKPCSENSTLTQKKIKSFWVQTFVLNLDFPVLFRPSAFFYGLKIVVKLRSAKLFFMLFLTVVTQAVVKCGQSRRRGIGFGNLCGA